ncbi:MAG: hypothetical protein Q4F61_00380 [Candidatus Saccharibacteria bacterium]|nr:hypothetical protein [Candidatus Saccharibacteria bacterium]
MSIVGMVSVTAINVNANEVISKIDDAMKAWMIASTMKKCLEEDIDAGENGMDDVRNAEYLDISNVIVGPWFENFVGGEVDDGKISGCAADEVGGGESMPQIFARYILGDESKYMSEIVCGNTDVFTPMTGHGKVAENCIEANNFLIVVNKVNGVFKKYYDEYVDGQDNKYLVKWDDINLMPSYFKYLVAYSDYLVGCTPGIGGVAITDKFSAKMVSTNYADGTFGMINEVKLPTGEKTEDKKYHVVYERKLYCGEIALYGISFNSNYYSEAIVGNLASFCKRELVPAVSENIENAKETLRPFYNQRFGNGKWDWEELFRNPLPEISSNESANDAQDYLKTWGVSSEGVSTINDWEFIERVNIAEGPIGCNSNKLQASCGFQSIRDDEITNSGWECRKDAGVEIGVIIDEPSDPGETNYEQDACYSASGSLSWIVCPVMQKLGGALDWIYDEMVEPFLKVNKGLLSGSEGTREAWGVVVGFANLAVVIFILIIIFSQLTGVGIDNYGIKKSLPKVVIAAVLINFSFVICQVAVDISNIVGNGLNSTLSDISVGNSYECTPSGGGSGLTLSGDNGSEECVPMSSGSSEQAGMFKTMFNVAAGGLIGVGAVSVASSVLSTGFLAGFLIPILLLLVTAVIAVLFFFVLLGMRQAGVVILVVLSPLALACYMLPNVKKYYDKWFKAFSGLLLVYPICGLLIGGGMLTSKIILSASTNYMTYFVGCVLMVAPFFLIPSLLKGSFAAMGNIGAKVSGLGKSFGSKGRSSLDRGIKNSNRYQQRVKENQERQALKRANRIHNRLHGKFDNVGDISELSRRQRRQLTRLRQADSTILGRDAELHSAKNMSGSGYEAAQTAQRKKADADALANEMMLIKSNTNDGANEAAVQEIFNNAMKSGNYMKARAAMRIAGRRKDTAANFLKGTLLDSNNDYTPEALSKVMKEISEGETSANWRSGSPVAFEYASRINDGTTVESYADWANNSNNIHNALEHHVTTASDLMGIQGSNLSSLVRSVQSGTMREDDANRIGHLAREAIKSNKEHGIQFDTTKAKQIYELAYGSQYQERMREDGLIRTDPRLDAYGGGYSDDTSASD